MSSPQQINMQGKWDRQAYEYRLACEAARYRNQTPVNIARKSPVNSLMKNSRVQKPTNRSRQQQQQQQQPYSRFPQSAHLQWPSLALAARSKAARAPARASPAPPAAARPSAATANIRLDVRVPPASRAMPPPPRSAATMHPATTPFSPATTTVSLPERRGGGGGSPVSDLGRFKLAQAATDKVDSWMRGTGQDEFTSILHKQSLTLAPLRLSDSPVAHHFQLPTPTRLLTA